MAGILGVTQTDYSEIDLQGSDQAIMKAVTIVSGSGALARGQVLGRITLTHKYTALNPAGADGSEIACGLLVQAVDATAADIKAHAFVQGLFRGDVFVWPAGITADQKRLALAQLQDRGIIADKDDTELAV